MSGRKSGPSQDWIGAVERACIRIDSDDGERAIRELKRLIEAQAMSVAPEEVRRYQRVVNLQLQELASTASPTAKCNCMRAVAALIDVDYTDSSSRTAQLSFFANFLSSILCTTDTAQADLAAATLGRVVKTDSVLMYDIIESECNRYLEWLSSDRKSHFYSAAVGFRELVSAAPALMTNKLQIFKRALWGGLEHESITCRIAYSSTMRALLKVESVGEDEHDMDVLSTCMDILVLFSNATTSLTLPEACKTHGALLALRELIEERGPPKDDIYEKISNHALQLSTSPYHIFVRVTAIDLLCTLASFCGVRFEKYISPAVEVCIELAKSPHIIIPPQDVSSSQSLLTPRGEPSSIRQSTFASLALLIPLTTFTCADGQRDLQLERIKAAVVEALEADPPCPGAAACAAVICDEDIAGVLLESAPGLPLNKLLTKPLLDLGKRLSGSTPRTRTPVNRPQELGRNSSQTRSSNQPVNVDSNQFLKRGLQLIVERVEDVLTATHVDPKGEAAIVALTALRDCEEFMRLISNSYSHLIKSVIPVLYHSRSIVRKGAASTMSLLLNLPDIDIQSSELVLTEVLKVGLADPAADVRLAALRSVKKATSYPSCAELLKLDRVVCYLCSSLVDEQAEARELSLDIVAGLVDDSELVTKRLQTLAKQVTTELQCPTDAVQQEQAARMVGHLARTSPSVLVEYDEGLNDLLIDRLSTATNHRFKAAILNTLCSLVESRHGFSSTELRQLQHLAVDVIGNQSSPATAPAARLLGHLLRRKKVVDLGVGELLITHTRMTSCSFAVEYPLVIPRLFECLKEGDSDRRTEVLQLLGIIGAIDLSTASHMKVLNEISTKATAADFDAHVAVLKLLNLLEHPSLAFHKRAAVQALRSVLRAIRSMQGARPAGLLSRVIATLLRLLQACRKSSHKDPALADALLRTLVHAIALVRAADSTVASENRATVITFVKDTIQCMYDFWEVSEQPAKLTIITLAEELHLTLNVMQPHTQWLLPRLIELARGGLCDDALAVRAVQAFETLAMLVTPFLIPVTACLLDVAGATDQLPELRIKCLQTIAALSKLGVPMQDVSARVVHALVKISQGVVTPVADARHGVGSVALRTLCVFSAGIGSEYEMFRSSVTRSLRQIEGSEAEEAIETLSNPSESTPHTVRCRSVSDPSGRMSPIGLSHHDYMSLHTRSSAGFSRMGANNSHHSVNMTHLENALRGYQSAHTEVEFIRWLDTLAQELLTQSPRTVLRACAQIGRGHPPLARSLFPPAFALCYNAVDVKQQVYMTNVIKKVLLTTAANPVLRPLLDLCVFVEKTYAQHFADVGEVQKPVHKFVPLKKLWPLAEDCQDFPLVLHWLETEAYRIEGETSHRPDASFWLESERTDYLEACRRLVRVNRCLEQQQQAEGILTLIKKKSITDSETAAGTYEDLGWWQRAFDQYHNTCKNTDKSEWPYYVAGMMRCREHLGDWKGVLDLSEIWDTEPVRRRTARAVSHAAWMLTEWDKMEEAVSLLPKTGEGAARRPGDSPAGVTAGFYRAILAIKKDNFKLFRGFATGRSSKSQNRQQTDSSTPADQLVDLSSLLASCRAGLEKDIIAHVNGTNGRGYELIVVLQHLAEIEEVIEYKEQSDSQRRSEIEAVWYTRLVCMRHDAWHLRDALAIRSLAVDPHKVIDEWLHFVNILEPTRARIVLRRLLNLESHSAGQLSLPHPSSFNEHNPVLVMTYLQHMYDAEATQRRYLIEELRRYSQFLTDQYNTKKTTSRLSTVRECLLMTAQWQQILNKNDFWTTPCREDILAVLEQALGMEDEVDSDTSKGSEPNRKDGTKYRLFHEWALLNLRIAHRDSSLTKAEAAQYAHSAVTGFVTCIEVCDPPERATQDILRLLRLLFSFGDVGKVATEIRHSFKTLSSEYWVSVIPQIVARIGEKDPIIASVVRDLLLKIASHFPQRVLLSVSVPLRGYPEEIYLGSPTDSCPQTEDVDKDRNKTTEPPDDVASNPSNESNYSSASCSSKVDEIRRVQAAQSIYASIRTEFPMLAEQVEMVTSELVSIATLISEEWLDALVAANRCWMAGDGERVVEIMSPLHNELLHPKSENDHQFLRLYQRELNIAKENWTRWQHTHHQSDMKRSWIYYGQVFARLYQQLRDQRVIQLSDVSSRLSEAKNVEVAVPGVFQDRISGPVICIHSFSPLIHVMGSKRRPKQITVVGSDGTDFKFLLKGQEDLRLDQRVMQVLRLINTLIRTSATEVSSQSSIPPIVTFAVVPLSPTAGLIGWVECAQTVDSIVAEMRGYDSTRIREEATMLQSNLHDQGNTLTVMQQTEALELTVQSTQANDLHTMLWLQSIDAYEWIERRTIFTRSIAMMSMVGYILGLGDRHPGNLLVGSDGKIVHIDFADCFETAMHRDTFPEKVPFRLTKMLVRAMGIGGVTGTFFRTACAGMNVLRKGKHPLMAMLEAFVYDPIVSLRLNPQEVKQDQQRKAEQMQSKNTTAIPEQDDHLARPSMKSTSSLQPSEAVPDDNQISRVIRRIQSKLDGADFATHQGDQSLDVVDQVEKLMSNAQSMELLSQCYIGWCPFW